MEVGDFVSEFEALRTVPKAKDNDVGFAGNEMAIKVHRHPWPIDDSRKDRLCVARWCQQDKKKTQDIAPHEGSEFDRVWPLPLR